MHYGNFIVAVTGETITLADILGLADEIGVVAGLIVVIYGGFKRWWVFSWAYNDLQKRHDYLVAERDKWQELALRSADIVESFAEMKRGERQ